MSRGRNVERQNCEEVQDGRAGGWPPIGRVIMRQPREARHTNDLPSFRFDIPPRVLTSPASGILLHTRIKH